MFPLEKENKNMAIAVNKTEPTFLSEPSSFRQRFGILLLKMSTIGFIIFQMHLMIPKMTLIGRSITIGFGLVLIGSVFILGNRICMVFSRAVGFFFDPPSKEGQSFLKPILFGQPSHSLDRPKPSPILVKPVRGGFYCPLTPEVRSILENASIYSSRKTSL